MNIAHWTAVDRYITDLLVRPDHALETALQASADAGLPQINVAPNQGKFLQLLATIQGAQHILEIGTLGGYSTIWLARALPPGGRLMTLESEPKHAEVARKNITQAGLADVVELRLGPALCSASYGRRKLPGLTRRILPRMELHGVRRGPHDRPDPGLAGPGQGPRARRPCAQGPCTAGAGRMTIPRRCRMLGS